MSGTTTTRARGAWNLRRKLLAATIAAGGAIAPAAPGSAQDASTTGKARTATADDIVVTGSRRSDVTALTSSTPVDLVTPKQMEQTGAVNVSRVLQYEIPSFHFTQDNPSNSVQAAVKGASLHGMSPDQTLILVNGVRMHLNAQLNLNYAGYGRGTQVADIDTLPAAAIGRVEVLRDGASAQYGSDAIAGVINFVLKTDDELKLSGQVGSYTALGQGLTSSGSFSWGRRFANGGYFHVTGEALHQEAIDIGVNDTRQYYFAGDPREATVNRHWFYGNGRLNRYGAMANGEVPLSDSITAFGYATAAYRQNYGFGNFRRPNDDGNVRAIYPDGFQPLQLITSKDYEAAFCVRHEGSALGKLTLTGSYGRSRASIFIYNTVNASLGTASGTKGGSGITINDDINVTLDQVKDIDVGFLAGPLTIASGLAYRNERYEIVAGDPFTYVNGGQPILDGPNRGRPAALGSQSASGFQPADAGVNRRSVYGGYVDVAGKLLAWLDLDLAGRTEHYSDFGWTTNGKVSLRAEVIKGLAVRGTVGTGYRAPSIAQNSYSRTTGIFINNVQYLQRVLPTTSAAALALGAQPLKPEKSVNLSGGVVVTPTPKTVLTADFYQIKVDDRIILTGSLQGAVVSTILANAGFPQLQGAQFFTNALDTRTRGFDLVGRHSMKIWRGDLNLSAAYNRTVTKITRTAPNPGPLASANITLIDRQQRGFITSGTPKSKLILSGNYVVGPVTFSATETRYGTYSLIDMTVPARDQKYGAQWVLNLSGQVKLNSHMRIDVGVDNALNSKPDKQIPAARNPVVSEYSPYGPIGPYGTFTYGRITFDL